MILKIEREKKKKKRKKNQRAEGEEVEKHPRLAESVTWSESKWVPRAGCGCGEAWESITNCTAFSPYINHNDAHIPVWPPQIRSQTLMAPAVTLPVFGWFFINSAYITKIANFSKTSLICISEQQQM